MKRPELLAPAGDMERLEYALHYGADAVYVAYTEFGMRTACRNFDEPALKEAVEKCHRKGARLYVTVNVYPTQQEAQRLPAFFTKMRDIRPDAFIIADIGVMALAQTYAPEIEIHISTQANITSAAAASRYYELGAKRVVLARELSLEEIAEIRRTTPPGLEIECFVHGAMCMSVSGRCHLSAYMTGRDANRGSCAQPCRWHYAVMEQTRPGQYFPVEQHENGAYIFNSKDLCMAEHIDRLMEIGIDSFKIEGRVKTFYYVAAVVKAYRQAIDEVVQKGRLADAQIYTRALEKVSHRGYSTGFYFDKDGGGCNTESGGYIRPYEVVAVVEHWQNGVATVKQKNKFSAGERLEVLSPTEKEFSFTAENMRDAQGALIDSAPHAGQIVTLPCERELHPMDILRKRTEEESPNKKAENH